MCYLLRKTFLWVSLFFLGILQAKEWRAGSFLVLENRNMAGIPDLVCQSGDAAFETGENEELYILNSNQVVFNFAGLGGFRYERFEQAVDSLNAADFFRGESRMILEMKRGTLMIDSSCFGSNAYIVVETPFGKLTLEGENLLNILISENNKQKRQTLEIESTTGNALFLDREGQSYQLHSGQRLSGYRKDGKLSLGFSQVSYIGRNFTKKYAENFPFEDPLPYLNQLKPYMNALVGYESKNDSISNVAESSLELYRPILIKIAPRPPPRLPYRVIKVK
ncbi:MAG: Uncharacterised protein [Opitutia bacterium UBA7350]|nr:MAG: Uncharacterised protein [Opitutae bacterium UBA7350]